MKVSLTPFLQCFGISLLVAMFGSSCSVENNDSYAEYFPATDGDKPDEFKFGYVRTCVATSPESLEKFLSSVDAFASTRNMLRVLPTKRNSKILASYSRGAPMRVHLLVKLADGDGVVMGISTLRGLDCDDCELAKKTNFLCPS